MLTLEQEGQKSGGAMPPVWKVEGPLAPLANLVPPPMFVGIPFIFTDLYDLPTLPRINVFDTLNR